MFSTDTGRRFVTPLMGRAQPALWQEVTNDAFTHREEVLAHPQDALAGCRGRYNISFYWHCRLRRLFALLTGGKKTPQRRKSGHY